tara:strand:+ start:410 stop:1357 length:948 start_codon:yes stop_codon:yes gene_type:complete
MTDTGPNTKALQEAIDGALDLVQDRSRRATLREGETLGSLLEQCQAWTRDAQKAAVPIRMIHHFACTGGTVISKGLATMPNTVVLSEIDPLSKRGLFMNNNPDFSPTDLIKQLIYSRFDPSDHLVSEMFLAALEVLYKHLTQRGQDLLIRDHPHSHFHDDLRSEKSFGARDIIASRYDILSLVTVRHPMASFLSLSSNNWVHFTPATLEEYARRYMLFLDSLASAPILKYEDFTHTPEDFLEQACRLLELEYRLGGTALISAVRMSGDSGRKDSIIAPRPNREMPPEVQKQIDISPAYTALCTRLSYDPAFTEPP